MRLVIGGYAQGKRKFVLEKYHLREETVWDGVLPDDTERADGMVVIDHFHLWVRRRMEDGGCPEEEILDYLDRLSRLNRDADCIIICDEIGNGIVPADAFERAYRERTGRILVLLARRAEEVERVLCGIGQRIK